MGDEGLVAPSAQGRAEGRLATKVCPQCGQVLFEDMDVCYGCLYDFSHEVNVRSLGLPATLLEDGVLDALDGEGTRTEPPAAGGGGDSRSDQGTPARLFALHVRSSDVELDVPLPVGGIMIGRLSTCDVVLKAKSVSRHHVIVVPSGRTVQVIDQGATNPALLDGVGVTSQSNMRLGSTLDVCGVSFTLVRQERSVADVS